jgi:cobalt-zinc-cadmium efflux system membrane fusion protein
MPSRSRRPDRRSRRPDRPSDRRRCGTIELPAIIEGDPQGTQVVSAAIAGRVVALTRNLGQTVGRGQTIAVIESREAAQIKGEVQAARARLQLANSNLAREQRCSRRRSRPSRI